MKQLHIRGNVCWDINNQHMRKVEDCKYGWWLMEYDGEERIFNYSYNEEGDFFVVFWSDAISVYNKEIFMSGYGKEVVRPCPPGTHITFTVPETIV